MYQIFALSLLTSASCVQAEFVYVMPDVQWEARFVQTPRSPFLQNASGFFLRILCTSRI